MLRRDDRTHARASHEVHRDLLVAEGTQHADVRETTSAAAAEHESDGCADEPATESREVLGVIRSNVMPGPETIVAEPFARPPKRGRGGLQQDQVELRIGPE